MGTTFGQDGEITGAFESVEGPEIAIEMDDPLGLRTLARDLVRLHSSTRARARLYRNRHGASAMVGSCRAKAAHIRTVAAFAGMADIMARPMPKALVEG